jgi:uncharacterized protein YkwD
MMLGLVLGAVLAAGPLTPEGLEQEAARYVREQSAPGTQATVDPLLTRAARRLARQALATPGGAQAPDTLMATAAAGAEGGAELITFTAAVRSSFLSHALELLQEKKDLGVPSPLLGVGVASSDGKVALVVLKGERRVKLEPFPRAFAPGKGGILCGELLMDLGQPTVHVTRPDGAVERVRLARQQGRSFCAGLEFPQTGTHTVTLSAGKSPAINMVGAFQVRAGDPVGEAEPSSRDDALNAMVRRIQRLRMSEGQSPVKRNAALERVAQAYADRMAREGFYGPKAPDGTTLRERIPDNGGLWANISENLGWGTGPLAACFGIEHTAESRRNLLAPGVSYVGTGLAWRQGESGQREVLVVQLLAKGPLGNLFASSPTEEAYRTLARLRPRTLPALQRSPVLETLAAQLAQSVQAPGEVTDVATYERVLQALPGATSASATVYEVGDALSLPRPAVLEDRATSDVGVAVVGQAPSLRVIVLTASRPRADPALENAQKNAPDSMMGGKARVH